MTDFFRESPWPGLILWVALFVSDYAFTIAGARTYRAHEKIVFEGSVEITPLYQADVDELRRVSPRFLSVPVLIAALIWLMWQVTELTVGYSEAYPFFLGMFIGLQVAVHIRHSRTGSFTSMPLARTVFEAISSILVKSFFECRLSR